jgi:undecaprenyl-diphosphatase
MRQPHQIAHAGGHRESGPSSRAPARRNDPPLSGAGPLTRSLDHRFASAPRIIPFVAILVVGYVGMVAVLVATGTVIVHWGAFAGLRGWDEDVTTWLADHRTGFLDTVTGVVSQGADTMGVVGFAIVLEIVLVVQRRWWALLIAPVGLVLELVTFLTVNAVVGRPRPTAPKLGSEPSTSSFPSGHVAATVVLWGAVALLFFSASSRRWVRSAAFSVVVVLACAVGTARVYRGMHHPSDVVAGGLMGLAALAVTVLVVRVTAADPDAGPPESDAASGTPERRRLPAVPSRSSPSRTLSAAPEPT